jgi:hypothetical protein
MGFYESITFEWSQEEGKGNQYCGDSADQL